MAKNIQENKPSKVMEILRKEYPFEKIILGVMGALVLILGIYLLQGTVIEIKMTSWWIFNTSIKRNIFAGFVILIGAVSFLIAVWPFFIPSVGEMKKVTWPNKKTILNHSARVFGFIIALALFFTLIDLPLKKIFAYIAELGA